MNPTARREWKHRQQFSEQRSLRNAVIGVLFLLTGQVLALDPDTALEHYSMQAWYSDDGLPHNSISSMAQTKDGYLWFATWNGLAKYNGREFKIFDSKSHQEFSGNAIRAISADAEGRLLIASARSGLLIYQNDQFRKLDQSQGLPSDALMSLQITNSGSVWVGTQGRGIARLADIGGSKFDPILVDNILGKAWVQASLQDADGTLWIGTTRGLYQYRNARLAAIPLQSNMGAEPSIYAILRDRDGVLWIGGEQGLYQLRAGPDQALSFVPFVLSLHPNSTAKIAVQSLYQDRGGSLWIGTQSAGVFRKYGDRLEQLSTLQGLTNNRVLSILQDREGSVWIGTNSGLVRLSDSGFVRISKQHGLSDDFVRSIGPGNQSGLAGMWVGTSLGVNFVHDGKIQKLAASPIDSLSITSVLQSKDGALFVGTYDSGLWMRSADQQAPSQWRQWRAGDNALPHDQVRAIMQTRNGDVWVGTAQGAVRLRLKAANWQIEGKLVAREQLRSSYIVSLMESADSRIWLGTSDGFLVLPSDAAYLPDSDLFDLRQAQQFGSEQQFPAQDVFDFHQDATGTVWMATNKGLVRFAERQFQLFGSDAGMPVETIFGVFEDRSGNFWLTSNDGLLQLPRAQIDAYIAKPGQRLQPNIFGRADGMSAAQVNGSSDPSGFFDSREQLWLPTARGVTVLQTNRLGKQIKPPVPVVIESVLIDQLEQDLRRPIATESGARRYEVNFAGLSFVAPERLRYRYRLNGYEADWFAAGGERRALFTNLPPGQFRFEVQAAPENGEFGEAQSIQLDVQPRLIERRWFWFVLVGLTLAIGSWLVRLLLKRHQQRQQVLEALVEKRTHELQERNDVLATADREKTDLLETIQLQSQAFARQAREDYLTSLANRRYFDLRADAAFAVRTERAVATCFAIADVDHFKRINDTFSHDIGDQVLRTVARVIADVVGQDGLAARFGGEEFGIYLQPMTLDQAQLRCERIRQLVSELRFDEAPDLRVTISIGVTDAPRAHNYGRAMIQADALLYQAKGSGRNRVEAG